MPICSRKNSEHCRVADFIIIFLFFLLCILWTVYVNASFSTFRTSSSFSILIFPVRFFFFCSLVVFFSSFTLCLFFFNICCCLFSTQRLADTFAYVMDSICWNKFNYANTFHVFTVWLSTHRATCYVYTLPHP